MPIARLIVDHHGHRSVPLSGVQNMALDEVLLRSAVEEGTATLRFYRWQPATLSLGYFQSFAQRAGHAASSACECVRRASGGGAILHDQELTYCLATQAQSQFGGDETLVMAFHETLVDLLREHGVAAELHGSGQPLPEEPFLCFERRASNDVIVDGYKVAGSAQRRWKQAIVQHGSVIWERSEFAPELPGLKELAAFSMTFEGLIDAWLKKLTSRLNVEFVPAPLTDKEIALWDRLQMEKFSTDRWTKRR